MIGHAALGTFVPVVTKKGMNCDTNKPIKVLSARTLSVLGIWSGFVALSKKTFGRQQKRSIMNTIIAKINPRQFRRSMKSQK
jgi:hypothetical protein